VSIQRIRGEDFGEVTEFLLTVFSSPTHWPDLNQVVSRHYQTQFYYLTCYEGSDITGICPIHEVKTNRLKRLRSGQFHLIPHGGWIFGSPAVCNLNHLPFLPCNASFELFGLPELDDFGVSYTGAQRQLSTLVLDLRRSEDDIWQNVIHSKRRNMIRKARKSGVIIQSGENMLTDFYALYLNTNQRNKLEAVPIGFFTDLLSKARHIEFLPMVAYHQDLPIGALGLLKDKDYAFYWLGAASQNQYNLGQGELLQWEAIMTAKQAGCRYYDLCYAEKERLPQIYSFKKDFSDRDVNVPYFSHRTMLYRILKHIQIK
jgi:hypothetical protein